MGDNTGIQWTDATWNPVVGCAVVSPGCTNCYAMKVAGGRIAHTPKFAGLTRATKAGPVWTGEVRLWEPALDQPLRWRRPRRIFVNSMSDLFHESVPEEWIDRIFAVMASAPQHTFQVLTKRAERMRDYLRRLADPRLRPALSTPGPGPWPWPHLWLGVSAEDQRRADERIPLLLETPAAKRIASLEPLLGPMDLRAYLLSVRGKHGQRVPLPMFDDEDGRSPRRGYLGDAIGLDQIIVGGESGPGARPMHPNWARSLRDQCVAAGVPFFFKQWGEYAPYDRGRIDSKTLAVPGSTDLPIGRYGKKAAGRLLDDREWNEMPP